MILLDASRMQQLHGAQSRSDVLAATGRLTSYLGAHPELGVTPVVVPVDAYPAVEAAYAAWDAGCDPNAANAVVNAINTTIINPIRSQLTNIAILGGDDLIPMARLADKAPVANEYEFRHQFDGDANGPNPNGLNALTSTFWNGDILSDEPYGDAAARSLGDRYLYVTDVALGRVVETPADVVQALDNFVRYNGTLQIGTATVLGYDFLADGSAQVASAIARNGVPVDADLADGTVGGPTGPKWNRADALAKLVAAGHHALVSLNAHFDQYRSLPASGDQVPGFADNLVATDVAATLGPDALTQSLVLSMGCHSGLSVSDILVGSTNADWAQMLGREGALFVGNAGFGYGDTQSVAYTERLMGLFAGLVTAPFDLVPGTAVQSSTVGQALAWAKNEYVGGLQTFSVYDEKAVMESTFYGLPFYRVGLTPAPLPLPPTTQTTPDATGTPSVTVAVTAPNLATTTADGTYYANPDAAGNLQTIVAPGRPIQPKTVRDVSVVTSSDPTKLSAVAHGGIVLGMSSRYVALPNPVIATPIFDQAANQPEPATGDVAFPTAPLEITTATGPAGQRQQLVLATGQYRSDSGVQRLDDNIGVVVYYADPTQTDYTPPTIATVAAEVVAGRLAVTVVAADAGTGVDRMYVLVAQNPGVGSGTWTGVDLVRVPGTDRWTGSLALAAATTDVEFIVQAKDHAGNVGVATNKAQNFDSQQPVVTAPVPPATVLTAVAATAPGAAGYYRGAVTINVSSSSSVTYSIDDIDRGPVPANGSFTITGDGVHRWVVTTITGYTLSGTVLIDTIAPHVTGTVSRAPNASGWYNAPATVSWSVDDPAATRPADSPITGEGAPNVVLSGPSCDPAGNCATGSVSVNVDLTPPTVTVVAPSSVGPLDTVTISCTASDALSGLATANCTSTTFPAATLHVGANVFTFSATDVAGNATTVSKTVTLVVPANPAPTVLADMGVSGLQEIGFQTNAVVLTGTFADPNGPAPFTAAVRWAAGEPFSAFILSGNGTFVTAHVYASAGVRTVTVRICDASGACGTDDVTVRTKVTAKITPVRECVTDRGARVSPRYLARWGYNNPAAFAVAVPAIPALENTFTAAPYLRGQPQVFLPGQKRGVFTTTFASGNQTWQINGYTATASSTSPRC